MSPNQTRPRQHVRRALNAPFGALLGTAVTLMTMAVVGAGTFAHADAGIHLRPDGDVIRQWTGTRGAAWAAVDDDVTQPARVDHRDYIRGSVAERVTEMYIRDHPLAGGTATSRAWFYANTGPDTRLQVEAVTIGAVVASTTLEPGNGYAWRSFPLPAFDQYHLDDLRLRFSVHNGGDSNVRATYVELSDIVPPPAAPAPPAPTERPGDRELAMAWAPYLLQDTADASRHSDFLSRVDYDGDWDTANNWEHADQIDLLKGAAYYSVVETETHWYLQYSYYHPRDWDSGHPLFYKKMDSHENDMEGVLLVVKRDGSPHGDLQGAVTVAHHDFFSYTTPDSELSNRHYSLDGQTLQVRAMLKLKGFPPSITAGPARPLIDAHAKSHAVHARQKPKLSFSGGDGVIYSPAGTGTVPSRGDIGQADYELINIFAPGGLWQHRNCPQTFARPGVFNGDTYVDNAANAPWRWDDNDDDLPHGDLAREPARLAHEYFSSATRVSTQYTWNPYHDPAPEEC